MDNPLQASFDPTYPSLLYKDTEHGRYWFSVNLPIEENGWIYFECDSTEYRCGHILFVKPSELPTSRPSTDPDFFVPELYLPDGKGGTHFECGGTIIYIKELYTPAYYEAVKWVIERHEKWLNEQFEKAIGF